MNINSLIILAKGVQPDSFDKEFSIELSDNGTDNEIKQALKELAADERKAIVKSLAADIMKLHKDVATRQEALVDIIRASRRAETEAKCQLAEILVAKEAASTKSNYLLLAQAAGYHIPLTVVFQHPDLFETTVKAKKPSVAVKPK